MAHEASAQRSHRAARTGSASRERERIVAYLARDGEGEAQLQLLAAYPPTEQLRQSEPDTKRWAARTAARRLFAAHHGFAITAMAHPEHPVMGFASQYLLRKSQRPPTPSTNSSSSTMRIRRRGCAYGGPKPKARYELQAGDRLTPFLSPAVIHVEVLRAITARSTTFRRPSVPAAATAGDARAAGEARVVSWSLSGTLRRAGALVPGLGVVAHLGALR
jgi:hypothetical protein